MIVSHKIFKSDGSFYTEYKGLRNDPKPVKAKEGDIFQELDTDSTFNFTNGKWKYAPAYSSGSGGSGEVGEIDILGSTVKLKDLTGMAVGYKDPDQPDDPPIVMTYDGSLIPEDPSFPFVKISDTCPFDLTMTEVEPGFYILNSGITATLSGAYSGENRIAYYMMSDNMLAGLVNIDGNPEAVCYFELGENEGDPVSVYVLNIMEPVSDTEQELYAYVSVLSQDGAKGEKGAYHEIEPEYLASPILEGTNQKLLSFDKIAAGADGKAIFEYSGNLDDYEKIDISAMAGFTYYLIKISNNPDFFDKSVSGLDPIMEVSALANPIATTATNGVESIDVAIEYIMNLGPNCDYLISSNDQFAELAILSVLEDGEISPMLPVYADKGTYVPYIAGDELNVHFSAASQDKIIKIPGKYLETPEAIGTNKTISELKKVAVGSDLSASFEFTENLDDYEFIPMMDLDEGYYGLIKISDDPNMFDISGEEISGYEPMFTFNHPITYDGQISSSEVSGEFNALIRNDDTPEVVSLMALDDQSLTGPRPTIMIVYEDTDVDEPEAGISVHVAKGTYVVYVDVQGLFIEVDSLNQENLIKIPGEYFDTHDAVFTLSLGKSALEAALVYGDFEKVSAKYMAGIPLNFAVVGLKDNQTLGSLDQCQIFVDYIIADGSINNETNDVNLSSFCIHVLSIPPSVADSWFDTNLPGEITWTNSGVSYADDNSGGTY